MTIMLKNADHVHFCDRDEAAHDGFKLVMLSMAEDEQVEAGLEKMKDADKLYPGEQGNTFTCGLGLAHFNAHLVVIPTLLNGSRAILPPCWRDKLLMLKLLTQSSRAPEPYQ
jgi:hypothetical protein